MIPLDPMTCPTRPSAGGINAAPPCPRPAVPDSGEPLPYRRHRPPGAVSAVAFGTGGPAQRTAGMHTPAAGEEDR